MKNLKYIFLSILAVTLISGCYSIKQKPTRKYTQQNLSQAMFVEVGMTKREVSSLMSYPIKTEFALNKEAWHWCRTGLQGEPDEFVVVMFIDGEAVSKNNYFQSLSDVGGAVGDCSKFVKSAM